MRRAVVDGGNYVITNRHVVSKCEGANVEFQDADGASKTYKNLKVIATDENLDIAILEFENGAKSFIKNMKTASSNDRNSIRGAFISYSPIEGLAYSVSLDVCKIFREGDFLKNAQIAEPEKDGDDYIVNFKTDSKTVQTKWTYETLGISGFWRMSSCETLSEQKSSKSKKETPAKDLEKSDSKKSKDSKNEKSGAKVEIEGPYKLALKVGMFPNIDKDAKNFGFAGGLIYMPFKIVGIYINSPVVFLNSICSLSIPRFIIFAPTLL